MSISSEAVRSALKTGELTPLLAERWEVLDGGALHRKSSQKSDAQVIKDFLVSF